MDKLTHYKEVITSILDKYQRQKPAGLEAIDNEVIIDEKTQQYILMRVGFENDRRVHYCVFHFAIKNDKIWLEEDTTDIPVAQLLLDAGIPKEDIVLAFHAPYRRELSGFAVA